MLKPQDKVTRFSADLVDAAAAEGARQSRSARQQLDHWVRVGRAVTSQETAQRARIEAVLAGEGSWRELSTAEATVAHAEIDASIEKAVAGESFGAALASRGLTTVALDQDGRLVEYRPDGTTTVLDQT